MFEPVGKLPPSVYWRRRLILLGVVGVVLLTAGVLLFGGGGGDGQASNPAAGTDSTSTGTTPGTTPSTPTSTRPSSTPITACTAGVLRIGAATGAASYKVGAKPDLYLVVTNTGSRPCTADLADKQVVLTVSTGDVRVWGSHDCSVQPGTTVRTLVPNRAVRLEIVWTGTTSVPGCSGQRLVVQAGTYSLTAALSGKTSSAVRFRITA